MHQHHAIKPLTGQPGHNPGKAGKLIGEKKYDLN